MRKIDDWFFAGLIAGIVGGLALNLYCLVLILLGLPTGVYWQAVGGLFYTKPLLSSWHAQIHGIIDSIGVSGANGILTLLVIKRSGTKFFYIKSITLSAIAAYFLFLVVYPQTALSKNNPYTPWVALFGHTVFLGWLTGYIIKKIYPFEPGKKLYIKNEIVSTPSLQESDTLPNVKNTNSKKKGPHLRKPKKI